MVLKRLSAEHVVYTMDRRHSPAISVSSKDTLVVETIEGWNILQKIKKLGTTGEQVDVRALVDLNQINPATGPIYVIGAEPGDAISVKILDIKVSDVGLVILDPEFGVLKDEIPTSYAAIQTIGRRKINFLGKIRIPVRPSIGTIGVAPREGEVSCLYPGDHGGNLDTTDVTVGSELHLPVFVKGALLALGDGKAAMGDGEVSGTSVDCDLEVKIRVNVLKSEELRRPRILTRNHIMTLASAKTMEEALRLSMRDMVELISKRREMTKAEAYMLTSLVGDAIVSQVVNPLVTVRMRVPRSICRF